MPGQGKESRFAEAIAEQRAAGMPLREQILWRIGELTNAQSINLAENAAHFPELIDGFTIPGIEPVLISHDQEGKLISKASLDDGGSIVATGFLLGEAGDYIGAFKRRLQLAPSWAVHEWLVLEPKHRGRGIAARFLRKSFGLYDELGLEQVHIVAGLETGRWYWAHMGFDFIKDEERKLVLGWANEVCAALAVETSDLGEDSSAGQIARLDCDREISLEALAEAMPNQRQRLEEDIAKKNGLEMTRAISLGRAIMLTGPQWRGFLQLEGPHRLAFEEAAEERERRAAQASGSRLGDEHTSQ